MPFIGIDKRAFRSIKQQLAQRSISELSNWGQESARLQVRDTLTSLLREYLRWPNDRFIPEDPCAILVFDPTTELRAVEARRVIEDKFRLPIGFLDELNNWSFGELVDQIAGFIHNDQRASADERGENGTF